MVTTKKAAALSRYPDNLTPAGDTLPPTGRHHLQPYHYALPFLHVRHTQRPMKDLQAIVIFTGTRNRDALQQTTDRQKVNQQGRACSCIIIMGHDFAAPYPAAALVLFPVSKRLPPAGRAVVSMIQTKSRLYTLDQWENTLFCPYLTDK